MNERMNDYLSGLVGGCFGAQCKSHYGYCPKMKKIGVHDSLSDDMGILILVNSFNDKIKCLELLYQV